ncbi:MAG: replicative DNA helicase [Clostridia bacterium]|nr:replicative DNA helicase [Clostridia bacterium]
MARSTKSVPRMMPHNNEAEQSVLGSVLIDDNASITVFATLKKDDFYMEVHQLIFDAMYENYNANKPIDFVTLSEVLNKNGNLDAVGGYEYIMQLTNIVPSAVNLDFYINIVKENSLRRKLIEVGQQIISTSYEADGNVAMDNAEKLIFEIGKDEERSDIVRISTTIDDVISKFELIQKDKSALRGITTGFYGLDKITNGLQRSDLILIAARPGVGKTSFTMNVITNAAIAGYKCAVFSLEMPKAQITQRILCSLSCVDMGKTLSGNMDTAEWERMLQASEKLKELDIYVDDNSMTNPIEILKKCRRLQRENGLDLIMIDYLQLMSSPKQVESRQLEISSFTRALKIAAKELNVPILVLSQLNRAVESRKDHTPMLADLRESGSIEQDADIVMFINRMDMYADYQGEPNLCELIIAKHRNGEQGVVPLRWRGEYVTFVSINKDADAESLEKTAPPTYKKKDEVEFTKLEKLEDTQIDEVF